MAVLRYVAVVALLIIAVAAVGCGAAKTTPHQWHGAGGLIPAQEDKDAGLVALAPGFDIRRYGSVVVGRCTVVESQIKDAEDRELAQTMPAFLQAETVRRVIDTGLFNHVASLGEAPPPTSADRTLRIECVITQLAPGSATARSVPLFFFYGGGVGRTKAEVEFRFVDVQTETIAMVSADRRTAKTGKDGELESETLLRESFDKMAHDLAKFLVRLSRGEAPRK
jgi:hypothetical protein